MALTMRENAFRAAITDLALAAPDTGTILDLECGTGSQLLRLAERSPGQELVGVDAGTGILGRARMKLAGADVSADLQHASAENLPLADASITVAISSLVLHHLTPAGNDWRSQNWAAC